MMGFRMFQSYKSATAASYQSVVLADSPLAYWPLNETTGTTAFDATTTPNNASILSGITLGSASIGSNTGASFSGTGGTNAYMTIAATKLEISAPFTVEEWFYNSGGIYTNGFSNNQNSGLRHQYQPSGGISVIYGNASQYSVSALNAPSATPLHVVTVVTSSSVTTYVNGVSVGSKANTTSIFNTYPYIASGINGAETLNGRISNVAVYNYALTPTQIANHYNTGK